jgi:hypothetical protein
MDFFQQVIHSLRGLAYKYKRATAAQPLDEMEKMIKEICARSNLERIIFLEYFESWITTVPLTVKEGLELCLNCAVQGSRFPWQPEPPREPGNQQDGWSA